MTLWLLEINSKLSKIEKFLKNFGIKPMTTCELMTIEAETPQDAINQSGKDSKVWSISVRKASQKDLIFMDC